MSSFLPIIGITTSTPDNPAWQGYADAVATAGGDPVRLVPGVTLDNSFAGFLLSGGGDVAPVVYGVSTSCELRDVSPGRDELELAIFKMVMAYDLPLLGICRGIQLLNVACGGTLIQDIPSQVPGALTHWAKEGAPGQLVTIRAGTKLAEIVGGEPLFCNSSHHQSVKAVGGNLIVSGVAEDGIIEAIEMPGRRFCLGVQWHPEAMWQSAPRQKLLFKAFVQSCI
jgi:putative glutamine amidotransferase